MQNTFRLVHKLQDVGAEILQLPQRTNGHVETNQACSALD